MNKTFYVTRENILVDVPEDQYTQGELAFSSVEGREVGVISVARFRELKKAPFQDARTYIAQFFNCIHIVCRLAVFLFAAIPALHFWLLGSIKLFGDATPMTMADLFNPVIFAISITTLLSGLALSFPFKKPFFGYVNCFEERFGVLLNKELPLLCDLEKYKMRWIPVEYLKATNTQAV